MTLAERLKKPFDRVVFRKRLSDPPSSMNPATAEVIADGMHELAERIGGVDGKVGEINDNINRHFERAYPDKDFTDLYMNGDEAEEQD